MLHIQDITAKLRPIWSMDTSAVQDEVLRCFRRECDMTPRATDYLEFLTAVDTAARAVRDGLADRKMLREYLRTVVRPHMVESGFILNFQKCCADAHVFEDLRRFVVDANQQDKRLLVAT